MTLTPVRGKGTLYDTDFMFMLCCVVEEPPSIAIIDVWTFALPAALSLFVQQLLIGWKIAAPYR